MQYCCVYTDSGQNVVLEISPEDVDKITVHEILEKNPNLNGPLWYRNEYYAIPLNDDCPLSKYPALIVTGKPEMWSIPTESLQSFSEYQEDTFIFYFNVKQPSNHIFPKITVVVPLSDLSETIDYLYQIIGESFNFPVQVKSIYCDQEQLSEDCTIKNVFDHALSCQTLTAEIELSDIAGPLIEKREKTIEEIHTTEITYVNNLKTIIDFWEPNLNDSQILSDSEHSLIFKEFSTIHGYHQSFCEKIQENLNGFASEFGKLFIEYIPFFGASMNYVAQYQKINQLLTQKLKDKKFDDKVTKLAEQNGEGDLSNFLITPIQRMPRYILLLKQLMSYTPENHPDYTYLKVAHENIIQLTQKLDENAEEATKNDILLHLQIKNSGSFIYLIPSRKILQTFDVTASGSKNKQLKFIVCNDYIFLISEKYKCFCQKTLYNFHYYLSDNELTIKVLIPTRRAMKVYDLTFNSLEEKNEFFSFIDKNVKIVFESITDPARSFFWETVKVSDDLQPLIKCAGVFNNGNHIYFGGCQVNGKDSKNDFIIYSENQDNEQTQLLESGIDTRNGHSMTLVNNKLFIIGGKRSTEILIYDGDKHGWMSLKSPIENLHGHTSVVSGNEILIYGGKPYHKPIFALNFDTFQIRELPNKSNIYPENRNNHSAVIYNNKMIICGGYHQKNVLDDIWVYDLNENTWEKKELLINRASHCAFVINDEMVVIGGEPTCETISVNLQDYSTRAFNDYGNIPPVLIDFVATYNPSNHQILIFGGREGITAPAMKGFYYLKPNLDWLGILNKPSTSNQNIAEEKDIFIDYSKEFIELPPQPAEQQEVQHEDQHEAQHEDQQEVQQENQNDQHEVCEDVQEESKPETQENEKELSQKNSDVNPKEYDLNQMDEIQIDTALEGINEMSDDDWNQSSLSNGIIDVDKVLAEIQKDQEADEKIDTDPFNLLSEQVSDETVSKIMEEIEKSEMAIQEGQLSLDNAQASIAKEQVEFSTAGTLDYENEKENIHESGLEEEEEEEEFNDKDDELSINSDDILENELKKADSEENQEILLTDEEEEEDDSDNINEIPTYNHTETEKIESTATLRDEENSKFDKQSSNEYEKQHSSSNKSSPRKASSPSKDDNITDNKNKNNLNKFDENNELQHSPPVNSGSEIDDNEPQKESKDQSEKENDDYSNENHEEGKSNNEYDHENKYSDNRYSENRYSGNGYSENKYSENRYSENKYSENRYSENKYSENKYGENKYGENRYSETVYSQTENTENENQSYESNTEARTEIDNIDQNNSLSDDKIESPHQVLDSIASSAQRELHSTATETDEAMFTPTESSKSRSRSHHRHHRHSNSPHRNDDEYNGGGSPRHKRHHHHHYNDTYRDSDVDSDLDSDYDSDNVENDEKKFVKPTLSPAQKRRAKQNRLQDDKYDMQSSLSPRVHHSNKFRSHNDNYDSLGGGYVTSSVSPRIKKDKKKELKRRLQANDDDFDKKSRKSPKTGKTKNVFDFQASHAERQSKYQITSFAKNRAQLNCSYLPRESTKEETSYFRSQADRRYKEQKESPRSPKTGIEKYFTSPKQEQPSSSFRYANLGPSLKESMTPAPSYKRNYNISNIRETSGAHYYSPVGIQRRRPYLSGNDDADDVDDHDLYLFHIRSKNLQYD